MGNDWRFNPQKHPEIETCKFVPHSNLKGIQIVGIVLFCSSPSQLKAHYSY